MTRFPQERCKESPPNLNQYTRFLRLLQRGLSPMRLGIKKYTFGRLPRSLPFALFFTGVSDDDELSPAAAAFRADRRVGVVILGWSPGAPGAGIKEGNAESSAC